MASWMDSSAGAPLVAVPSLWPEPFGIVGIEAMAMESRRWL
jgi:glycosyltransferase involved in cell wall biosynthesis